MNVGAKVRKIRLRRKATQRQICEDTGLAVSYLSRLENGRVNPSVSTLQKLATSLEVPVSTLFDVTPVLDQGDQCPVSMDGVCILDKVFLGKGRRPAGGGRESYTREQLELLRLCNYLLHSGKQPIQITLATFLRALADSVRANS